MHSIKHYLNMIKYIQTQHLTTITFIESCQLKQLVHFSLRLSPNVDQDSMSSEPRLFSTQFIEPTSANLSTTPSFRLVGANFVLNYIRNYVLLSFYSVSPTSPLPMYQCQTMVTLLCDVGKCTCSSLAIGQTAPRSLSTVHGKWLCK